MDKKNIILNHSLEEYNKKYRNRRDSLLKITKKEVEEFDKKNHTATKGYVLNNRKWWLIKDTYYEIPKPIRYTWFRNLHSGIQISTCILLCGIIATSIALPIYFTSKVEESLIIDSDTKQYCDVISNKIKENGDRELLLQTKGDRVEYKKIEVKIGNDVLKEKEEYEYKLLTSNDGAFNYSLTIFKAALDSHKGKIIIKPVLVPRLKITDSDLNLTLGEATHQLKVIDLDTGNDLTNEVFYYGAAHVHETCGFDCDQDGLISTLRVGGGYVVVSKVGYIADTINVNVKADSTKGNKTLTLTKNIDEAGYVYGSGTYPWCTLVTACAFANTNYRFVRWEDKDGKTLTEKDYYQLRVKEDVELKAVFEHNLELFKRTYEEYFNNFDQSTECPYSGCTYKESTPEAEEIDCTLEYKQASGSDPKVCNATPAGLNAIPVAGGIYTYDKFIAELEGLKSQQGYKFDCSVEGSKKNLILTVIDPDNTCYGYYKFNSNGYLLQYGKTDPGTKVYSSYTLKYKLK